MINKLKYSLHINVISNWLSLITHVLVSFFLTPFIIKQLGLPGYGLYNILGSIVGYYSLLELGVGSAIVRYVAVFNSQKDYDSLNEVLSTALMIFLSVGGVIIVLSLILADPLVSFFNVDKTQSIEFRRALIIFGTCVSTGLLSNLFGAAIIAQEKFVIANSLGIFCILTRTAFMVYFLLHGLGLEGISYAYLISIVIALFFNLKLCYFITDRIQLGISKVKLKKLKMILAFSLSTSVIAMADMLRLNMGGFIIGKMISLSAVGIFSIATVRASNMIAFIGSANGVLPPRFAALFGKGDMRQFNQLLMKSFYVFGFISAWVGTLLIILGKEFILLWVGPDFLKAVPVLWILVISLTVSTSQVPGISAMFAVNKHIVIGIINLVEGVINLILSVVLVASYGMIGVALGMAIPMLLSKLIIQPFFVSKILKIPLYQYYVQLAPPFAVAGGIILLNFYLPFGEWLPRGYLALIIKAIPYSLAFIIGYFLFDINNKKFRTSTIFTTTSSN